MFGQEVSATARPRTAAPSTNGLLPANRVGASTENIGVLPSDADDAREGEPDGTESVLRRTLRAVIAAVIVGTLVIVAQANGVVPGNVAVAISALIVLAIPTSRSLSRRLLLAACLFFGWVPVLYWWDLPTGGMGRSTLLVAVIAAALVGWVVIARRPVHRMQLLLPSLRVVDVFALLAGLAAAAVLWTWLQAKSGASALAMMTAGWDHSAHYSMAHSIRIHGVTAQGLATPGSAGQAFQFDGYPQNFHATVVSLMELLGSATPGSPESEISLYTQAVGLAVLTAVVMVCAGLCALSGLRRRPAVALPLVVLVGAAFVLGPGGAALQDGFPNFLLATALVAAIPLLTVPLNGLLNPLHLAALGGAVVGIAHGWALLLLLALPGVLIMLLPFRRRRWMASQSALWLCAVIVAATIGGLGWAAVIIIDVPLAVLATPGGVSIPPLGLVVLLALSCLAACLLVQRFTPNSDQKCHQGPAVRSAWLATLPVVGIGGASVLAGYQLSTAGELSYYFWKYLTALELLSVVALAIGIAALLSRTPERRVAKFPSAVAVGTLAVAATQVFGLAVPDPPAFAIAASAPGAMARDLSEELILQPPLAASMIDDVERFSRAFPGRPVFYMSVPSDGQTNGYSMTQWFLGLTDTWTFDAQATVPHSVVDEGTVQAAAVATERVLLAASENIVAVGPAFLAPIRQLLDPELADRVVGW